MKVHNNIERNKTTINCAISVFFFRIIIGSPIVGKGLKGLDGHFQPKLKRLGQASDLLHVWAESPRLLFGLLSSSPGVTRPAAFPKA